MKKVILFIALTVVANASYNKAKAFYDAKEYQKAVVEAKSSTEEYSNPKLHLIWGESEEALGDEKQAMSAYERVVMLDENNVEARVKLVKIYQKTHRIYLAKKMKKELQNYQLIPKQRSSLALLEQESISSIKAKVILSMGYDSNINVSAKEHDLNTYYKTNSSQGKRATLFSRLNGNGSYINELAEKGGWYVRSDLKLYYQDNFNATHYDMFIGGLVGGIGYTGSNYMLYVPLSYDRIHYLGTDMLAQVTLTPKLSMSLSKNLILDMDIKYASRSYVKDKYKNMNDNSYGASAGFYYLFDKNFFYTKLRYEDFSSTKNTYFSYIDRTQIGIATGVNYNLRDIMIARVDYKYRKSNYSDLLHPLVTTKRADDYNQVALKLSHYFHKSYELFISDKYIKNSSNYVPAKYTKNIVMFGMSANY